MTVLERIRKRLNGSTHWPGCEEDDRHILCAAEKEIGRLERELEQAREELSR